MKCKICETQSFNFSKAQVLKKYNIDYFLCPNCGFVQTEEPFWLEEAYSEAIAKSDVGLVFRNIMFSKISSNIIFKLFNHNTKFLDYGGGYGLFVRLMRDAGFDFYWYDQFCKDLFAQGFESNLDCDLQYELVTAFEVFEHLINPLDDIKKILKYSRNILFSTELLPLENPPRPNEWWYYAVDEGQHISLYTARSIQIIAEKFNLNFYTNGSSFHLLTENQIDPLLFKNLAQSSQFVPPPKVSLLQEDFLRATGKLEYYQSESFSHSQKLKNSQKVESKIIIDGVFFQLYKTGIYRVWQSVLEEWVGTEFANDVIVLDRAGTAPAIPGINYLLVPAYDYNNTEADRVMLQQVCDEQNAILFISTYYTTPLSTPSVFMAYDMIPEVLGANFDEPMWREKHYAIGHACSYISISENTARDLVKFFPNISPESITVAHCGIKPIFSPATADEVMQFKQKYGISKPYFLGVGISSGYKNASLFFQAFSQLYTRHGFEIVCTGSGALLLPEFRNYTEGVVVHTLQLSDEELKTAYTGAVALVYPSKYEGFGLPVLEAIACGCPVITCPNSSIPEVAGEAAIYIHDTDVNALASALCEVQKPEIRQKLINTGLEKAKNFSWSTMAQKISSALLNATLLPLKLKDINLIIFPNWDQPEESLTLELEQVIKAAVNHPNRSLITLLIDASNIAEEDANLILSTITMNLLMQEDLDIESGPGISLIMHLSDIQWEVLLSCLYAKIPLKNESNQAKRAEKLEEILLYTFTSLNKEFT